VGFALPGVDLRLIDADGVEVSPGEIGSIEVRGPNVFSGYWQMPEKTRQELREDGWFITGDLGCADADGYLSIVGRSKDLIISGGYNIYPKEIESLIDRIGGVLESAVIGIADADFGEKVIAVIVPEAGKSISAEEIQDYLSSLIAKFKQPRQIHFVDALPRNAMGKVQKNQLRETYSA
jgi:malonyl-CoA/methylmalonyl-CoA synthetase